LHGEIVALFGLFLLLGCGDGCRTREGWAAVRVKVDAFPFTDYGTIDGTLIGLSSDVIEDEKLGLYYLARLRLARSVINNRSRSIQLTPGMAVSAEIKTGRQRIIQYLLSPITTRIDEAGRERKVKPVIFAVRVLLASTLLLACSKSQPMREAETPVSDMKGRYSTSSSDVRAPHEEERGGPGNLDSGMSGSPA
jgi:outer membrane murein-binding lipoprotein Lpp